MAKKTKPHLFTGISLEQWHSDFDNLRWAQTEPRFQMMLSVVLNEMATAAAPSSGMSEGRAFGRVEGYQCALEVLRAMGRKPPKELPSLEATHDERPEKAVVAQDAFD